MIIDSLENAEKYSCLHPLFSPAFKWIEEHNLDELEPGKYEISNNLTASVTDKGGLDKAAAKLECHNSFIDIQILISEKEKFGWSSRNSCLQPVGEYDAEKDVLFYDDEPGMYFELKSKEFAIFFPEDVHAPMIAEGPVKKMVIKVKK